MLSARQRGRLAATAQGSSCLAAVGRAGATAAFVSRLDELLRRHELVKLRLAGDDAESRAALAGDLAARTGSEVVRIVGKVAILYRANPALGELGIDLGE
jgi:RNA-binding protein